MLPGEIRTQQLVVRAGGVCYWAPVPSSARLALIPVGFAAVVYSPVLRNYFWADDFLHLYQIVNTGWREFVLTPHGGHIYLVRNTIFYLLHHAFDLDPQPYFACVLATHLVNVAFLFRLIRGLTGSSEVACFGATLWGVCPVNEGSLGWYSLHGHLLVGTVWLWVMSDLVSLIAAGRTISSRRILGWYLLLVAGITCFGIGIALAMVFPLVVFVLLPPGTERRRLTRWFAPLVVVAPAMLAGFTALYQRLTGSSAGAPALVQHLSHWHAVTAMFGTLLVFGTGSVAIPYGFGTGIRLGADGWRTLRTLGLQDYVVTAVCAGGVLVVLVRSARAVKRRLLVFVASAVATYGIIAAGRGPFYEIINASIEWEASTPRYHYVGTAVIAVVFCLLLSELGTAVALRPWLRRAALSGWLASMVALYLTVAPPLSHHDQARRDVQAVQQRIAAIIARRPSGQPVFLINEPFPAIDWDPNFEFPGCAGIFMLTYPTNVVDGHSVYFVEPNPAALAAARRRPRSRVATLLIGPQDLPKTSP